MTEDFVIDELGRGAVERDNVNMVIYGRSGAGKTYEAATAPSPFIAAADPRGHDSIPTKLPGKLIRCLDDMAKTIEWFESGKHVERGIRTLIVDGGNFLYDMFYNEIGQIIVGQRRAPSVDRLAYGGGMEVLRPYKRMLERLVNLTTIEPVDYRVNVILTYLEDKSEPTDRMPYSLNPLFGTKAMNQTFPALFSVIGYIMPIGETKQDEETGQLVVDQTRRMLFTEYNGILARDRLGIFPPSCNAPNLSEYLK